MQEIFNHIATNDLAYLQAHLNAANVNDALVIGPKRCDHNQDPNDVKDHYSLTTVHKHPLHEAIRHHFVAGVELCLHLGAHLSKQEATHIEHFLEVGCFNQIQETQHQELGPSALDMIENAHHPALTQVVFDHICKNRLHDNLRYKTFLYATLSHVKLNHFTPDMLGFDVGHSLPKGFADGQALRTFLVNHQLDITGIHFTEDDYLNQSYQDETALRHALTVCQFSLPQLQHLYRTVDQEALRVIIVDHNNEVDPDFADQLDVQRLAAQHQKELEQEQRTQQQTFNHLRLRQQMLTHSISVYTQKAKLTKTQRDALKRARDGLERCQRDLKAHPLFQDENDQNGASPKRGKF